MSDTWLRNNDGSETVRFEAAMEGGPLITIGTDGNVTIREGLSLDEASAAFWRVVGDAGASIARERDALRAQLAAAERRAERTEAEHREMCQFLVEWDQQDSFRDYDYRDQLVERYTGWVERARNALAAHTNPAPDASTVDDGPR